MLALHAGTAEAGPGAARPVRWAAPPTRPTRRARPTRCAPSPRSRRATRTSPTRCSPRSLGATPVRRGGPRQRATLAAAATPSSPTRRRAISHGPTRPAIVRPPRPRVRPAPTPTAPRRPRPTPSSPTRRGARSSTCPACRTTRPGVGPGRAARARHPRRAAGPTGSARPRSTARTTPTPSASPVGGEDVRVPAHPHAGRVRRRAAPRRPRVGLPHARRAARRPRPPPRRRRHHRRHPRRRAVRLPDALRQERGGPDRQRHAPTSTSGWPTTSPTSRTRSRPAPAARSRPTSRRSSTSTSPAPSATSCASTSTTTRSRSSTSRTRSRSSTRATRTTSCSASRPATCSSRRRPSSSRAASASSASARTSASARSRSRPSPASRTPRPARSSSRAARRRRRFSIPPTDYEDNTHFFLGYAFHNTWDGSHVEPGRARSPPGFREIVGIEVFRHEQNLGTRRPRPARRSSPRRPSPTSPSPAAAVRRRPRGPAPQRPPRRRRRTSRPFAGPVPRTPLPDAGLDVYSDADLDRIRANDGLDIDAAFRPPDRRLRQRASSAASAATSTTPSTPSSGTLSLTSSLQDNDFLAVAYQYRTDGRPASSPSATTGRARNNAQQPDRPEAAPRRHRPARSGRCGTSRCATSTASAGARSTPAPSRSASPTRPRAARRRPSSPTSPSATRRRCSRPSASTASERPGPAHARRDLRLRQRPHRQRRERAHHLPGPPALRRLPREAAHDRPDRLGHDRRRRRRRTAARRPTRRARYAFPQLYHAQGQQPSAPSSPILSRYRIGGEFRSATQSVFNVGFNLVPGHGPRDLGRPAARREHGLPRQHRRGHGRDHQPGAAPGRPAGARAGRAEPDRRHRLEDAARPPGRLPRRREHDLRRHADAPLGAPARRQVQHRDRGHRQLDPRRRRALHRRAALDHARARRAAAHPDARAQPRRAARRVRAPHAGPPADDRLRPDRAPPRATTPAACRCPSDEASGVSYVDDFEGSENAYSQLGEAGGWRIAAAPESAGPPGSVTPGPEVTTTEQIGDPRYRANWRGLFAWYSINENAYAQLQRRRPAHARHAPDRAARPLPGPLPRRQPGAARRGPRARSACWTSTSTPRAAGRTTTTATSPAASPPTRAAPGAA